MKISLPILSIFIKIIGMVFLFGILLLLPKILDQSEYSNFIVYNSLFSIIVLAGTAGFPHLMFRNFYDKDGKIYNVKRLRNTFITVQLAITILMSIFILTIHHSYNEFDVLYALLILLSCCFMIIFRVDKNLLVSSGVSLKAQSFENILLPLAFLVTLLIFEPNVNSDIMILRMLTIFLVMSIAYISVRFSKNYTKSGSKIWDIKKESKETILIIIIPILSLQMFLDILTWIVSIIWYEVLPIFELGRRFGTLPYLLILAYFVPVINKIIKLKDKNELSLGTVLTNIENKIFSFILVMSVFSTNVICYLYLKYYLQAYQEAIMVCIGLSSIWVLFAKGLLQIQLDLLTMVADKLIVRYITAFVVGLMSVFIIYYFSFYALLPIPVFVYFLCLKNTIGIKKLG